MEIQAFDTEFSIDEYFVEEDKLVIRKQLEQYFSGDRESFDLNISFPDSFTGEVMQEIAKIPYGDTRTYGEIAEALDSSPIAVGQACGNNPVPVIVPCHRVVGKNSLGGYSLGLEFKESLLGLESADF